MKKTFLLLCAIASFCFIAFTGNAGIAFADCVDVVSSATHENAVAWGTLDIKSADLYTPSCSGYISEIDVVGRGNGGPPGNFYSQESLYSNTGGVPDTQIGSGILYTIPNGYTFSDTNVSVTVATTDQVVTAGTQYWVVGEADPAYGNQSNYATMQGENSGNTGSEFYEGSWSSSYAYALTVHVTTSGGGGGGGGGATTTATSTPGYLPTMQEELFIYMVILFILAVGFWESVLTLRRSKYEI
jgi:hypothetical protein